MHGEWKYTSLKKTHKAPTQAQIQIQIQTTHTSTCTGSGGKKLPHNSRKTFCTGKSQTQIKT